MTCRIGRFRTVCRGGLARVDTRSIARYATQVAEFLSVETVMNSVLNVLVVDDDPMIVRALERRLVRAGHVVVGCVDVESAMDACARTSFDVVVADLHVGAASGADLVRSILGCSPHMRAIFLTGEDVDALDVLPGMVIQKPVRGSQLLRVIA